MTTETPMRERIARAILDGMAHGADTQAIADAVLDTMREPDNHMLSAAVPCPEHLIIERADAAHEAAMRVAVNVDELAFTSKWRAAIDAAKEGK